MKKLIVTLFVAVAVTSMSFVAFAAESKFSSRVIAYYFHGDVRCPTCHKLEQYSKEAIETNFRDVLASGKLEFKAVNVDNKGNEHYSDDYKLYTKSLILSLVKDGKEVKWKNLDKIWEYVGNKDKFLVYVKDAVVSMLQEAR